MPEQEPPFVNGPEADLAERLQALRLAVPQTSQREIWYRAGLQAGRRRTAAWRGVATAASILAGGLLAWNLRPAPLPAERIVYVHPSDTSRTAAAPQAVADSSDDYLRLRDAILRDGLRGLPPSEPAQNNAPPERPDPTYEVFGYPLNQRG